MLPLNNHNVLPVNMQRGSAIHLSIRTCYVLDYQQKYTDIEIYWGGSLCPERVLRQGKPIRCFGG